MNTKEEIINKMVDRFLGWKLPADFAPDAGITFKPNANPDSPIELQYKHEPIGTNLFTADQVKALLLHLTDGLLDDQNTGSKFESLFMAACEDLAAVSSHLGLDPNDGGAEPIIDAIEDLKRQHLANQTTTASNPAA